MRVQPADELPRHHRRLPSPPLPQHRRHRARYHTAVSVEHIHDGRLLVDVRADAQVRAVLGHGWHRLCHDLWVYGRGIWHSKVRHRYRKRWCFQAGPDHEVSHSGCYVWNYCCLRSGGGSADSRKHEGAAWAKLQSIQWLHALSVWPFSRFDWVSSGICNRDSWRCGSTRVYATVTHFRRHGAHSHFRRSAGTLRLDCGAYLEHKSSWLEI
ncbi:hypothetical protein CB0940_08086 [Cercospora beticola]|uniref:Uncharacterized protein n=1 Tax=Cercospora beticola TaxID=122368 RepID=A0A2G5HPA6_CERBT|nr:hypothetical protein CB0940_08086 [Cercospora beticola]PIA94370.1 hypothetical protein CB0940_08086 [Cercospora beticola]